MQSYRDSYNLLAEDTNNFKQCKHAVLSIHLTLDYGLFTYLTTISVLWPNGRVSEVVVYQEVNLCSSDSKGAREVKLTLRNSLGTDRFVVFDRKIRLLR